MKKLFLITLTFLALTFTSFAQDGGGTIGSKPKSDVKVFSSQDDESRVKVFVGVLNSNVARQDFQGANLAGEYNFVKLGNVNIGGVLDVGYFPMQNGPDSTWYAAGPKISYEAGRVEVFGRSLFGGVNYVGVDTFTKSVGGGVDLNFGPLFVRPFQADFQWIEGQRQRLTRVGIGGGVRF